jgi:hypothetical protein
MEKKYRRTIGRFEFWHFHPDCAERPQGNYIQRAEVSPGSRMCPQCVRLHEKEFRAARETTQNPRR